MVNYYCLRIQVLNVAIEFWKKRCRLPIGNEGKPLDLYEVEVIEKGENKGFLKTEETDETDFAYGFLELT